MDFVLMNLQLKFQKMYLLSFNASLHITRNLIDINEFMVDS